MSDRDRKYKDIPSVESLFTALEPFRIRRLFLWSESLELGRLILNKSFRTERQAIDALSQYYRSEQPAPTPPTCTCPEPRDRRWHKVDEGLPVTWSHNPAKQGFIHAGRNLRNHFAEVETLCGIKFQETADRDADIHITWDELDGAGGTLGVTYVPASGDRMAACGPLCGDIVFDTSETWTNGGFFDTVAKHEIGHALGLPHSDSRNDLMFRQFLSIRGWQPADIAELLKRYPLKSIT